MIFVWRKHPVRHVEYVRSESGQVIGILYTRSGEDKIRAIHTRPTITRFMRDHARALWMKQR